MLESISKICCGKNQKKPGIDGILPKRTAQTANSFYAGHALDE